MHSQQNNNIGLIAIFLLFSVLSCDTNTENNKEYHSQENQFSLNYPTHLNQLSEEEKKEWYSKYSYQKIKPLKVFINKNDSILFIIQKNKSDDFFKYFEHTCQEISESNINTVFKKKELNNDSYILEYAIPYKKSEIYYLIYAFRREQYIYEFVYNSYSGVQKADTEGAYNIMRSITFSQNSSYTSPVKWRL